jgi:hypothetical protein
MICSKALILFSFVWLPLTLHERIHNYITNRSILIRTFKSQVLNDKDFSDIFGYKMKILIGVVVFFILL